MTIVSVLLVAAGVLALLAYVAHRAALWAESRGWIYYRQRPRFRGSSLGYLEEIYNPAMHHVMEERDSEHAIGSQEESGDGPDAGAGNGTTPSSAPSS